MKTLSIILILDVVVVAGCLIYLNSVLNQVVVQNKQVEWSIQSE